MHTNGANFERHRGRRWITDSLCVLPQKLPCVLVSVVEQCLVKQHPKHERVRWVENLKGSLGNKELDRNHSKAQRLWVYELTKTVCALHYPKEM
jgi:hypothetical protein